MLQSQSDETGESVTKTQKIKWGLGSLASIATVVGVLIAFADSPYSIMTRASHAADIEAVTARFAPTECEALENSLRRLRNDRRAYMRELKENPEDSFADLRRDEIELEIREKESKREALGCG